MDSSGLLQTTYGLIKADTIETELLWQNNSVLVTVQGNSYLWYLNGQPIAGAGSNTYIPQASGEYNVVVVMSNGCISVSNSVNVIIPGIGNEKESPKIKIYPNPSHDRFNLIFDEEIKYPLHYKITGSRGEMIGKGSFIKPNERTSNYNVIDLSSYSPGIYLLHIQSKNKYEVLKLVKE